MFTYTTGIKTFKKETKTMNFWDSDVWSWILIFAVLTGSLLVGNTLRRKIPFLKSSLIPTSVIGGTVLLIVAAIYKAITGEVMFDSVAFGGNGTNALEIITYHALALGFIASSLKTSDKTVDKKRLNEIFNTGVTTVSTYLLQGILGMAITIVAVLTFLPGFFKAAGLLLPFGYGQGTGQALNYGIIYESHGFAGGSAFGLTIAALGFISAALGGVIHLNIRKANGKLKKSNRTDGSDYHEVVEAPDEIPMQESVDKLTIQISFIIIAYVIAYVIMTILGNILPGMKATIYGFNFLLGVIGATIVKGVVGLLRKSGLMHRKYINNFLLTRTSNFFFDLMVVAGVAAIRLDELKSYWGIVLILSVVGLLSTYLYLRFVCKKLFPDYEEEQFLMMYGMLTGTASTGTILLREIDGEFKTPAADNMVYQNFPAIVFGFPLMLLANLAPKKPELTLIILVAFFIVMNVILFRSFIFKKKAKK
jgi:ESS family glutamate:Na+ symporter